MKNKKLNQKLSLSKSTIANLGEQKLNDVKAGNCTHGWMSGCQSDVCDTFWDCTSVFGPSECC